MPVILENFLKEYSKEWTSTARGKEVWEKIREELYMHRSSKCKDIPNDTVSKQILEGRWDTPDGVFMLSKTYREYARRHTDYLVEGGITF